jgi:membrane peptidoglycan carboxypeptidase
MVEYELTPKPVEQRPPLPIEEIIQEIEEKVGPVGVLTKAIWRIGGPGFLPIDPFKPVIKNEQGEYTLNFLPENDPRRQRFKKAKERLTWGYIAHQPDVLAFAYLAEIPEDSYDELIYYYTLMKKIDQKSPRLQKYIFNTLPDIEKKIVANFWFHQANGNIASVPPWARPYITLPLPKEAQEEIQQKYSEEQTLQQYATTQLGLSPPTTLELQRRHQELLEKIKTALKQRFSSSSSTEEVIDPNKLINELTSIQDPQQQEEAFNRLTLPQKQAVADAWFEKEEKKLSKVPKWARKFITLPPPDMPTLPSTEEILRQAQKEGWDLYGYFNDFLLTQQQDPQKIKFFQRLGLIDPKKRSLKSLNALVLAAVTTVEPLPQTQYTPGFLFDRIIFNFSDGVDAYKNFCDYLQTLEARLTMTREMETDPSSETEAKQNQLLLGQRLTSLIKTAAEQILIAAECGECHLTKKQRRQLEKALAIDDWSFFFGWDETIKDVITQRYGKKYWRQKRKKRKLYIKTVTTLFQKIKELSEKKSPFAVVLEEDEEKKKQTQSLTKEYEKWKKNSKLLLRANLVARLTAFFTPLAAAFYISHQPLPRAIIEEIPEAAKAAYEDVFLYLEKINADRSPIDKVHHLIELGKALRQIKQKHDKEVLFSVGNNYLGRYAEELLKNPAIARLSVQENAATPPLSENDFFESSPQPPKTVGELLSTLEQKEGRQQFLSALADNFYQRGSFRFSNEDRFTFIPYEEVRQRLDDLIESIKKELSTHPNQNQPIDSLNRNSKKQGAIGDLDEVVIEILKYLAPSLEEKIALVEPETQGAYVDWPLEFVAKRNGYLGVEKIFTYILTSTLDEPTIKITDEKQLDDFFSQNSLLPFNPQEFRHWLERFSSAFGDETTKWEFVSWALTLAKAGEIDVDLITRFVDLNRFNQTLHQSMSSLIPQETALPQITLTGLLSLSATPKTTVTRREFLKATLAAGVSLAASAAAHYTSQQYESTFAVLDQILQRKTNGRVFQEVERRLPPLLALNPTGFPEALVVKTSDGQEIGRYFEMNKEFLPFDQIPENVKEFLVAVEDKRFWQHHGVDPVGMVRALSSPFAGGGSTLTQQLVRLFCFSQKERLQEQGNPDLVLQRKIVESVAALTLERKLTEYFIRQGYDENSARKRTKEKILELYLNNVPFGPNVYGIKAASKFYFNKEPRQLTRIEIAFLIGLIQDPVNYNPLSTFYFDRTGQAIITGSRQDDDKIILNDVHPAVIRLKRDILPLLLKQKLITTELISWVANNPIAITPPPPSKYESYAQLVINQLAASLSRQQLFSGLEVVVPLDLKLQSVLEEKISEKVAEESQNRVTEGTIIVLDAETGAILACAGARMLPQNSNPTLDNMVAFSDNYPGSSVKPFTYALALAEGSLEPNELLTGSIYRGVHNAGGNNYGPQPWPVALASSLNTAAQQVADRLGATAIRNLWDKLGLRKMQTLPLSRISTNITLGTERGRPIDLAAAFTPFINGGKLSRATPISQINNRHGQPVFVTKSQQSFPVFSEEVAQLIFDALSNPENKILPTEQTWAPLRDGAGWYFAKTGTESNASGNQRAVWVVGGMIHPQTKKKYIVLTYLGTQDNQGMASNVWGITTLGPLWREVLDILLGILKERQ